nr:aminotransferase class III-fold pyridoxal phosphate-dependent enzyme [uncultured Pedobacter sp.]
MIELKINITTADGDFLIDESGQKYFDLCMGYGSVSLGHNYAPVVNAQIKQLQTYSSPGFIESAIHIEAKALVEKHLEGYYLHGFYPSGANAVEIALKMAMLATGRPKIISFANSMHGKTLFAGKLGFESCLDDNDQIIRLPFVGEKDESHILQICEENMRHGDVAAVIIEPIQMSGGGFQASAAFYHSLQALAARFGVIQIYDEILVGFYRTGSLFFYKTRGLKPDVVLVGKAMGSGFPVSAILLQNGFTIPQQFRGGGTYFNHPLACASIIATLNAYKELDIESSFNKIESTILKHLPAKHLAGKGALWNIDLGSADNANSAVAALLDNKIIVSFYGRYIRFFPNFNVDLSLLSKACELVKQYL